MRSKDARKTKRYKALKVPVTTAAFQNARVLPCQNIQLVVPKPCRVLLNNDVKASFRVIFQTEFFILVDERVEGMEDDESIIFTLAPKYDLSEWTSLGEVFLGNIKVEAVDSQEDFESVFCIVQQAAKGSEDAIVAINPTDHTIKMQPTQQLEVVCYRYDWKGKPDRWNMEVRYVEGTKFDLNPGFSLKMDRHEQIDPEKPTYGPFAAAARSLFEVNPRLDEDNIDKVKKELESRRAILEHHWWFSINEHSRKAVLFQSNGDYPTSRIKLDGKDENSNKAWNTLNVRLAVQGKAKNKLKKEKTTVEYTMKPSERYEDRENGVLINPFPTELIDFYSGGRSDVTVEIAQPNVFWDDLNENERWEILETSDLSSVTVETLPGSERKGTWYQKLRITNRYNGNQNEIYFLDHVRIVCRKKEKTNGVRKLSCWMSPTPYQEKKKIITPPYDTVMRSYTGGNGGGRCRSRNNHYGDWETWNNKGYTGVPKIAVVKVEELLFENLSDQTRAIQITYDDGTKKKETPSTDNWNDFSPSCQRATSDDSGSKPGERKEIGRRTFSTAGTSGSNDVPALIIHNPTHLQQIMVEYGKDLIIRMELPGKTLNEPALDELWTVSTGSNDLEITKHITTGSVSNKYGLYQEVHVKIPTDKIPLLLGTHSRSMLKCQCSKATRILFVHVKVTASTLAKKGIYSSLHPDVEPEFRIIQCNYKEAGSTTRHLGDNWNHYDAVVVNPQDSLFVRNPSLGGDWTNDKWQLEVEQVAIPPQVAQILKQDKVDIDYQNPWMKRQPPLNLNAVYILRPLTNTQPETEKILAAIRKEYEADEFPVAWLHFRNDSHKDNVLASSPYGTIRSSTSIERTLGLFVSLRTKQEKRTSGILIERDLMRGEMLTENPPHDSEIRIMEGDKKIIIEMPTCLDVSLLNNSDKPVKKCPWFLIGLPDYLGYEGCTPKEKTDMFSFHIQRNKITEENKRDSIQLLQFQTIRNIKLIVK